MSTHWLPAVRLPHDARGVRRRKRRYQEDVDYIYSIVERTNMNVLDMIWRMGNI